MAKVWNPMAKAGILQKAAFIESGISLKSGIPAAKVGFPWYCHIMWQKRESQPKMEKLKNFKKL